MATIAQGLGMADANETQERASHVLVVDDEDIIRVLLTEILTEEGYEVTAAADGKEAVDILEQKKFDLIITDMVMPGMNGIEVLQSAFRLDPSYAVVMITGFPSVETAVRLVTLGAADYITKPFNVDLIKVTVAKVLASKRFRREAPQGGGEGESSDQMAPIDKVTGAYNLYLFTQLLETEVARSTFRNHDLSLLMVDIDKYENYTSKGGPSAGDQLVKTLVNVMRQESRPGDIIGRLDSSEVAMILTETGRSEAEPIGQKVRKSVEWNFTISGGIACLPRDTKDAAGLLRTARAAIQAAKSRGGDAILLPK